MELKLTTIAFATIVHVHEPFRPHFLLIVLLPKKEGRENFGLFLFLDEETVQH